MKTTRLVGRVVPLPSGRFRFVTEIGGKTRGESFDTEGEARSYQRALSRELAATSARPRHKLTLAEYARGWFARRRADGDVRDLDGEIRRWESHVESMALGRTPLTEITAGKVAAWFRERCGAKIAYPYAHPKNGQKVAKSTVKKALVVLRLCLDEAVVDGKIAANPARAFKLKRGKTSRTHEPWTYLTIEEQLAILAGPPTELTDLIRYALGTGCRQGEQWNQRLDDLFEDRVVVRYGSESSATKSGKLRRVPLLGMAKEAVDRQLARLAERTNPHGLLWPSPRGARREKGKLPAGWRELCARVLAPAGRHDQRPVRWHDLRHTCASSLVAGWWGPAWTLQAVRDLLGHSSITVTEKYAHLAPSALIEAARATMGPVADPAETKEDRATAPSGRRQHDADPSESAERDALLTRRSRVRVPFDPLVESGPIHAIDLAGRDGVRTAALAFVAAAASGSSESHARALDLAEAVLAASAVADALAVLDGDPLWAATALRLAERVLLDDPTVKSDLKVRGGSR